MSVFKDSLLLHPQTHFQARQYLSKPTHALLVLGAQGAGKKMLARNIAAAILEFKRTDSLFTYPYFLYLSRPADKQNISIEMVRELINKLKLKTTGKKSLRRIVLIENAQDLSHEAQNALLKILEEPSEDTLFLLTATSENSVLPTVASRAQKIYVYPISLAQAQKYFASDYAGLSIESAWKLAQGNVGLLDALLSKDKAHPLKEAVDQAKKLLHYRPYERLLIIDRISRDKTQLNLLLAALNRVLTSLHHSAIRKGNSKHAALMLNNRRVIEQTQAALESNAAPRLIALQLSLNLSL